MAPDPISVGDWLKMAVARFNAVSSSPQLDAEILLQSITGIHRTSIYARPEQKLTSEQLEDLRPAMSRRESGEPIAYIIGRQEFWSMSLEVSSAVLIPRPDTELLVERALERIPLNEPSRVLDLGTGSGAIALALAHARANAQVVAVDVDAQALAIATRNQRSLAIRNLNLQQSDWFSALAAAKFDLIVSNPPYVATDDPHLEPAVAKFEPKLALISGPTGLEAIERIALQARDHLNALGWLLFEHGANQGAAVRSLLVQCGFDRVITYTDLAGRERVSEGQLTRSVTSS